MRALRTPIDLSERLTEKMEKKPRKSNGWRAAGQHLKTWDTPGLLGLIKELYSFSAGNRDFIDARTGGGGEALERYRAMIVEQFFPKRGYGKLKLGVARKAIRDYRKATGDIAGAAELMMTYVENGAEFTHTYGDIDERFYNSIESVLYELSRLLTGEAIDLYPQFRDRLAETKRLASRVGWGFSDYVAEVVQDLADKLGDRSSGI